MADPDRPIRSAVVTRQTGGAGVVAFSPDATFVAGTAIDGSEAVTLWPIR